MKKLKKSVKVILFSFISAICVAGIVLGCVFAFRGKKGNEFEPIPTPTPVVVDDGKERAKAEWEKNVALLGNQIEESNNQSGLKYYLVSGAPYEKYVDDENLLCDLTDTYFVTKHNSEKSFYFYEYKNDVLSVTSVTQSKDEGGFAENEYSYFDDLEYNDDYVIFVTILSDGDELATIVDIDKKEIAFTYSLKNSEYVNAKLEENSKERDSKVNEINSSSDKKEPAEPEELVTFEDIKTICNIVISENNTCYFYTRTSKQDNNEIDVVFADLDNKTAEVVETFSDDDVFEIEFIEKMLVVYSDKTRVFAFSGDKVVSAELTLKHGEEISNTMYISENKIAFEIKTVATLSGKNAKSVVGDDVGLYNNFSYKIFEVKEDKIDVIDFAMPEGVSKVAFENVASDFYKTFEFKVNNENIILPEGEISYYLSDGTKVVSFVGLANEKIIGISGKSILTDYKLFNVDFDTDNKVTKTFLTDGIPTNVDDYQLYGNKVYDNNFLVSFVNSEGVSSFGIMNFDGEIVKSVSEFKDSNTGEQVEFDGVRGSNGDFVFVSGTKFYKINPQTLLLDEIENAYSNSEIISKIQQTGYDFYLTDDENISKITLNKNTNLCTLVNTVSGDKVNSVLFKGIKLNFDETETIFSGNEILPLSNKNKNINDVETYDHNVTVTYYKYDDYTTYISSSTQTFHEYSVGVYWWGNISFTVRSATSRTGYTFAGWKCSYNGSIYNAGDTFEAGTSYTHAFDDVNFGATWTLNYYDIYFHSTISSYNGSSTSSSAYVGTKNIGYGNTYTMLSGSSSFIYAPSDCGWSFAGWSSGSSSYTVSYTGGASVTCYGTKHWYSVAKRTWTIEYMDSSGSWTNNNWIQYGRYNKYFSSGWNSYSYYGTYTASSTEKSDRGDWTFIGWHIHSESSHDVTWSTNPSPSYTTTMSSSYIDALYRAQIDFKYYTDSDMRTLHGSGDEYGYADAYTTWYDVTTNLHPTAPTKRGHTFSSWYDSTSDRSAGNVNDDYTVTPAFRKTTFKIYATWTVNTYTITLDKYGNVGKKTGEDLSGSGTSQFWFKYGTNTLYSNSACTTIISNKISIPSRTGYIFGGYRTGKTSGTKYINDDGTWISSIVIDVVNNSNAIQYSTLYAIWTPIKYTIVFDANSGTIASHAVETSQSSGLTLSGTTFTATYDQKGVFSVNVKRMGYQFNKWDVSSSDSVSISTITKTANNSNVASFTNVNDTTSNVKVTTSVFNLTSENNAEVKLTVDWSVIKYKVVLAENTGNLTDRAVGNGSVGMTYDAATLTFELTYDKEGIISVNAQKTGYQFTGWNNNVGATLNPTWSVDGNTSNKVTVTTKVKNITAVKDSTVTFTALWGKITYYIKYNGDTGNGANGNKPSKATSDPVHKNDTTTTVAYDEDVTLEGFVSNEESKKNQNDWTLVGWHQDGWSTVAGGEKVYELGQEFTKPNFILIDQGVYTLFPHWVQNQYTLHYNSNKPNSGEKGAGKLASHDVEGSVDSVVLTYDENYTLSNNNGITTYESGEGKDKGYKLVGWKFVGWGTSSSPNSYYSSGQTLTKPNFNAVDGGEYTLYAQWTPNTYKFTLESNGSEISNPVSVLNVSNSLITFVATYDLYGKFSIGFIYPGYVFKGWVYSGNDSKHEVDILEWTQTEETNLEFNFKTQVLNLSSVENDMITLTAQWEAINYTIRFDENNGSITGHTPITAVGLSGTVFSAKYDKAGAFTVNAKRDGYLLKENAWIRNTTAGTMSESHHSVPDTTQNVTITTNFNNLTTISEGVVILTAQWDAINYTISFDASNGDLSEFSAGSGLTLSGSVFIATYDQTGVFKLKTMRVGYLFNDWFKEGNLGTLEATWTPDNNTTKKIQVETTALNLTKTSNADVVLTAQWSNIKYKIAINANEGTANNYNSISNITDNGELFTATYDREGQFSISVVREGYYFSKFSVSGDGATITDIIKDGGTDNSVNRCAYTKRQETTIPITVTVNEKNLSTVNNSTITLTIDWSSLSYTIRYDGNQPGTGGNSDGRTPSTFDVLGSVSETSANYSSDTTLASNSYYTTGFTLTGWTYLGWSRYENRFNTTPDYASGETISDKLTTIDGDVVTLYAVWKENTYNINYVFDTITGEAAGHAVVGRSYPTSATFEQIVKISAPEKLGYTFARYEVTGLNTEVSDLVKGHTKRHCNTVSFANGVNNSVVTTIGANETSAVLTYRTTDANKKTIIATDWYFKNLNSNYNSKAVSTLPTPANYTVTFTAKWEANKYNYYFDIPGNLQVKNASLESHKDFATRIVDDDPNTTDNPYVATYDSTFSVTAPTCLGFTFTGWTITGLSADCKHYYDNQVTALNVVSLDGITATSFKNLRADSSSTVKFTANWTNNVYHVKFVWYTENETQTAINNDSNITAEEKAQILAGTRDPNVIDMTYGVARKIYNPTRVGYDFTSWTITGMSNTCEHIYQVDKTAGYENVTKDTSIELSCTNFLRFTNLHSENWDPEHPDEAVVVFTANWTAHTYNISYVVTGSGYEFELGNGEHPGSAVFGVPIRIEGPDDSKLFGYHFGGWVATGLSTDCDHYAGATSANLVSHGTSSTVNTFTEDDFYYQNLSSQNGATIILTAIAEANYYNINFNLTDFTADSNGGDGTFNNLTGITYNPSTHIYTARAQYNEPFAISEPVRTGYTFTGWKLYNLSDKCSHYYYQSDATTKDLKGRTGYVKFESENSGYFNKINPNIPIPIRTTYFENLHCDQDATVTLNAGWEKNKFTITYHYLKSNTPSSYTNINNFSTTYSETKIQNVEYDSFFVTMGMTSDTASTTAVVVPNNMRIIRWVFSKTELSNGASIPRNDNENALEVEKEYLYNSYTAFPNSSKSPVSKRYELFSGSVHAYAYYETVTTTLKFMGVGKKVDFNNLSKYTELKSVTTSVGSSLNLPATLGSFGSGNLVGYMISSNKYESGEITSNSITNYPYSGTNYTANAGTNIVWGYPINMTYDFNNPVFYVYAVYNKTINEVYSATATSNYIKLTTNNMFVSGKTYEITIRGLVATNYYDYDYVQLATAKDATGTNSGFNKVYSHEGVRSGTTTNSVTNLTTTVVNETTLVIRFTANSNSPNYSLFLVYDSSKNVASDYLNYIKDMDVVIFEV